MTWLSYPSWLNAGDNAWQMTAATFVGLMSLPGLAVLYGGVMQKRWSVNSMMLTFVAFCVTLDRVVPVGVQDGLRSSDRAQRLGRLRDQRLPGHVPGRTGQRARPRRRGGPGAKSRRSRQVRRSTSRSPRSCTSSSCSPRSRRSWRSARCSGGSTSRRGSRTWLLWITFVYTVNAFLLWGGGYFAAHGALDYSGGYVIHLAAGISGFVFAAVIGPRLQRDREVDAPNNLLMVAVGAACCGSAGTASTAGTPTTRARTPRRRCSTPTCAPRWR